MEFIRTISSQDISWFLDTNRNGMLDLEPSYQRRSVWSAKDRRFFLDTIFRGYPCPPIYMHKEPTVDGKTKYAVVDGKQRIETILRFADNKIAIDMKFGDTRLDGKKWRDILSCEESDELRRQFWDYTLPVVFVNINPKENTVNEIFDRLNRNVVKLKEQELRHARYDGWFISFVENEATKQEWQTLRVVTPARGKRMSDVQFLSELLIVLIKGEIGGFNHHEIDQYYADYEELSEVLSGYEEEVLIQRFEHVKKYLLDLENKHSIADRYAREVKNFYSLWALVALNLDRLPEIDEFAQKYSGFMNEAKLFKNESFHKEVQDGTKKIEYNGSFKYYQNGGGPNTEGPQRKARHEALMSLIFGDSENDENSAIN